jgi:hypothetical protein
VGGVLVGDFVGGRVRPVGRVVVGGGDRCRLVGAQGLDAFAQLVGELGLHGPGCPFPLGGAPDMLRDLGVIDRLGPGRRWWRVGGSFGAGPLGCPPNV